MNKTQMIIQKVNRSIKNGGDLIKSLKHYAWIYGVSETEKEHLCKYYNLQQKTE